MTDTTPADLTKDEDQEERPVLQGLEHIGSGYLVSYLVKAGQKGFFLDLDAASLGLQAGAAFSLTPASIAAAVAAPIGLPIEDGTVSLGVGIAPKTETLITVMVVAG